MANMLINPPSTAITGMAHPKYFLQKLDGTVWSTVSPGWVTYNSANIANYGIAATEIPGTGIYWVTDPSDGSAGIATLINASASNLAENDLKLNGVYFGSLGNQPAADSAGTTTLLSRITAAVALAGTAPTWYSAPVTPPSASTIADTTLRRTMAHVEASSDGDTIGLSSLYGFIQQAQESDTTTNAGKLTVFKTNGSTTLGQISLTSDAAANPITGAKAT